MISYVYKLVCIKEFFLDSSHCMHAFETKKLLRFLCSKIYHTASSSNAVLNIGHRILPLSFFFVGDNKLTNTISLRYQSLQSVQTLIDWQDSSQGLHALCSFWLNKLHSVLWHIWKVKNLSIQPYLMSHVSWSCFHAIFQHPLALNTLYFKKIVELSTIL